MKKYKILLYLFLIMQIIFNNNCTGNNESIAEYNEKSEFSSVILNIYIDTKNHHLYRFKIEGLENDFYSAYYINSWKYASIGDSIIKKKGEPFIIIKKGDGSYKKFETQVK
ncbi:hypothetical protein [Prevotella sp. 10(H)]|uniref:hypothetical protein n=1 Tax=Prevotella sp. 10(H) TaxID=1158294 RepID=UPI0004A73282|nr:hypothetical protein [Prevotella sp. 10(H)]